MYKCDKCNKICENDNLPTHTEDCGEFIDNCICGGDFVEAFQCKDCEDWFTEEELTNGYCKNCINSEITVDTAINFGADSEEEITINGFLANFFSAEEVNEILKKEAKEAIHINPALINNAYDYCNNDLVAFAEYLNAEVLR